MEINSFSRKAAFRIAAVSIVLAALASVVAWFVAREKAEESTVALAIEESQRLISHSGAIYRPDAAATEHAVQAAKAITGGLFDIAEIYDRNGLKLAETMTAKGEEVEPLLSSHGRPAYTRASYESINLADGRWVLRVFVPLRESLEDPRSAVTGYFEGVRVVPEWQQAQMRADALGIAALVGLAALLCGAAIYPVVVNLSAENERRARDVLGAHLSTMEALGRAIAKRDSDTGGHNCRVAWIAIRLAEQLGVAGSDMQALIVGSFLHDIGKIAIPDAILLKPGKLDESEFSIMRTHVEQGEEIIGGIGWLEKARNVVSGHHEKWDGTGYPRRLEGLAIPLSARIFAVADVFDALCSRRPYKEAMGFDAAMAILERDAGRHFDPRVMDAFRQVSREIHDRLACCSDEECRALLDERVRSHFGLA